MDKERIKVLFKKLYDAHRWVQKHPAIDFYEQHRKLIIPSVEKWCDELEEMGINRTFSMCIFVFGSDWKIMYSMLKLKATS